MLIGRKKEIAELERVLKSPKGEMIAVLGRRRMGKTFLINETYEDCIVFEQIGVRNASNAAQLRCLNLQLVFGYKISFFKYDFVRQYFFSLQNVPFLASFWYILTQNKFS